MQDYLQHTDLIGHSINKKVLLNKDGTTRDIVKEVLQVYADSRNQLQQFAPFLKGDTLLETCSNIWHFWKENVKYKIDPEGVQWIKTPDAFWDSDFGDCKSFAIAVAASLHALDIKGAFRFVSFGNNTTQPTHVFVVVKDKGQEIIIDCVWNKFNETKPWAAKWDYNMTSIYEISGVGATIETTNGRGNLMITPDSIDGMSNEMLDLLAHKQLLELQQQIVVLEKGIGSPHDMAYEIEIIAVNNAIAEYNKIHGITDPNFRQLKITSFGKVGMPLKRVPQVNPANLVEGIGNAKKRQARQLKRAEKKNKAGKAVNKHQAKLLTAAGETVVKKKKGFLNTLLKVVTAPIRLVGKAVATTVLRVVLPKHSEFFLYTFLTDDVLPRVSQNVRDKRVKALRIKDKIIHKLGMKESTFSKIIRSGIANKYKMTPEQLLASWLQNGKLAVAGLSGIGDDDDSGIPAMANSTATINPIIPTPQANQGGAITALAASNPVIAAILQGLQLLEKLLGINFGGDKNAVPVKEDFTGGDVNAANAILNSQGNQPLVTDPSGNYGYTYPTTTGNDGYVNSDDANADAGDGTPTSLSTANNPKELDPVNVTLPKKNNNSALLIGGIALLAIAATSKKGGKGKK